MGFHFCLDLLFVFFNAIGLFKKTIIILLFSSNILIG